MDSTNKKITKDKEGRKEDAKKIQEIESRFYENKYPNVDDLVMCQIISYFDDGAYVELLEYNRIKGMILSSEISRKRVKYVKKIVKEGREEVLRVLRVDQNQGYIDLSKKSVKVEEVEDFKEKYFKSKKVDAIMKNLSIKSGKDLEYLYQNLGWPLYKLYGHAHDAFKEALNDEEAVLGKLNIDKDIKADLVEILKIKMVPEPVKIRADFKLTCYKFEGIDAIKAALIEGEKLSTPDIPIKFRIIGSPIYECSTVTINKKEGLDLVKKALKTVETSIRLREGNFLLQTMPTISGENAVNAIQEQLNQLKNKENVEEDSEEDHEEGIIVNMANDDDLDITKPSKGNGKKGNNSEEDDD